MCFSGGNYCVIRFFLLKWQDELGLLREEEIGQCLYRGIHMK